MYQKLRNSFDEFTDLVGYQIVCGVQAQHIAVPDTTGLIQRNILTQCCHKHQLPVIF